MSEEPTADDAVEAVAAPDEDVADELRQAKRLSHLFDESIPLPGGRSIGLDPIVGLLPVVGDVSAASVSVYIVMEAIYLGVPRSTVMRMVENVAVDTVVGGVPVVGDLFDAWFKANARNVALLEQRLEEPSAARADRRVLLVLGIVLVAASVAVSLGVAAGAWWLAGEVGLL